MKVTHQQQHKVLLVTTIIHKRKQFPSEFKYKMHQEYVYCCWNLFYCCCWNFFLFGIFITHNATLSSGHLHIIAAGISFCSEYSAGNIFLDSFCWAACFGILYFATNVCPGVGGCSSWFIIPCFGAGMTPLPNRHRPFIKSNIYPVVCHWIGCIQEQLDVHLMCLGSRPYWFGWKIHGSCVLGVGHHLSSIIHAGPGGISGQSFIWWWWCIWSCVVWWWHILVCVCVPVKPTRNHYVVTRGCATTT